MKSKTKIIENSSILWWIFGGCSLITLYFNSKIQDPFNSPKMWILLIISAWLLGHLIFNNKGSFKDKNLQKFALLTLLFSIFLFISAIKTDVLYTAFLGENQRRNGFLAYIALIIFMLSASGFIKFQSLKRFNLIAFLTGLILAVYGLMQISGFDFIKWNNPYNAIISTVGNPNFAAAVMAMMAAIIFGPVLNSNYNKYYRFSSLFLTLILLYTIYLSDARQGLIAFAIGIGVYITIWLYTIKYKLRHIFLGGSIAVGIFSILGMLQIGPLTSFLYKSSVTVRCYYWRAGIEMFLNHPWFGVGIDRYGAYFKEYREVTYPLNYGFTITSTNAHNLPIQIFATAGIFAGISYILLLGFIAWRGILGIRNKIGAEKLQFASIFSAWLAYQAQSIISIDNIGISIWGWVLGGAVVGLSIQDPSGFSQTGNNLKSKIKTPQFNFKQVTASSAALITVLILIIPLFQSEKNMFETRMRFNPDVAENRSPLREYALKILSSDLAEPSYKINVGSYLAASGFLDEGIKALEDVSKSDPRNLDSLMFLAQFNEQLNKPQEAINYRIEIAKYDPWNAANYLQLGRNYKALGDITNMNKMREKINSFASTTQEAAQANSDLV
jgi:O-antigen ligase